MEHFQMGTINGVPAADFNLDSLEDKPWRKPGADITDYFNYGFNEDTWRAYCERQKRSVSMVLSQPQNTFVSSHQIASERVGRWFGPPERDRFASWPPANHER